MKVVRPATSTQCVEVAHSHFSGDVNFDVSDIVNLYSEHGSDASHPGSDDSGSGHGYGGH
jgi:hypothetical protein